MSTDARQKFITFYENQLRERENRLSELVSTGKDADAKVERFNIANIHDILRHLRGEVVGGAK